MIQGWTNLKAKQEKLRAMEKHYREKGYSDGYALLVAQSRERTYQQSWKRGRADRRAFDAGKDGT